MKQCPVCKTTYTDDSLRFCLADRASLFSISNEQETVQMSAAQNPLRIDIQKDTAPTNFSPAASQINPKQKCIVSLDKGVSKYKSAHGIVIYTKLYILSLFLYIFMVSFGR